MSADAAVAAPVPASSSPPVAARRPRAVPVLLWLAAALISGFTLRRSIGPVDEGILMQAASRLASGQWPWRDFSWAYGPGEPLVVMAAGKLFGPSLLWWRLFRVAADATCALLVWALVRDERPRWALAAWAAAAVTAAQPVSANPAQPALAFALGAVLLAGRGRPAWAGVAAAGAAFWRPDMGAAAALAAAVTAGLAARGEAAGARGQAAGAGAVGVGGEAAGARGQAAGAGAVGVGGETAGARGDAATRRSAGSSPFARALVPLAAAILAGAVLYLPFAVAAGPSALWDALVVQGTRDGAWWHLPFPDGFHGSDPLDLLRWLLPYAALIAVLVAAPRRPSPTLAGLLVLALGAIAYFLSRADQEHAQTLLIIVTAIAAIGRPKAVLGTVLALLLITGAGNRASALLRAPRLEPLHVARAGGTRVTPEDASALPSLVGDVHRLVPKGEPIYVAPARSDIVPFSDPLLHFLTDRPNILHRDFLLQAKPSEQRRIVAALQRTRPRAIIRWLDSTNPREPNLRGRSTGSRALDAYIDANYRQQARYGAYVVLVPR